MNSNMLANKMFTFQKQQADENSSSRKPSEVEKKKKVSDDDQKNGEDKEEESEAKISVANPGIEYKPISYNDHLNFV